jgi:TonB family protein
MQLTEVTDVLAARRQRPENFGRMVVWSAAVHVGAVALLLFGPFDWKLVADEPPRTVMTISLAGAPGPRAGGMTPMGGRAVPAPTPEKPRAVPPPPPKPRAMPSPTAPVRRQQPKPQPQPEVEEPQGVTRTETGARGQGFGLATGGSGGSGVQLDVANFCCPDYIEQMVTLIQRNWQSNQGVSGSTVMQFTITRSGSIQGVRIERPSGFVALDLAAERALLLTRLPELPVQFPNPTLTVHLTFEYGR